MNMTNWTDDAPGSLIPQNLCIMSVTGTRKRTTSHAPIRARYPMAMLKPPSRDRPPAMGTATFAKGTPRDRAKPSICLDRFPGAETRKIKANRIRPIKTTALLAALPVGCELVEDVAVIEILAFLAPKPARCPVKWLRLILGSTINGDAPHDSTHQSNCASTSSVSGSE